MVLALVWYGMLYCLEYDTKTSTKHITSIQADGTTAPTTGFRGSTDCYLDFITIPRLVTTDTDIVIKLVKFYKKLLSSGSLDGSQPAFDRFCGAKLGWTPAAATNQPIICEFLCFIHIKSPFCLPAEVVPFTVGVRFDNDDGQDTPYGVALSYQQLPC